MTPLTGLRRLAAQVALWVATLVLEVLDWLQAWADRRRPSAA